jgi:hypothetical protein
MRSLWFPAETEYGCKLFLEQQSLLRCAPALRRVFGVRYANARLCQNQTRIASRREGKGRVRARGGTRSDVRAALKGMRLIACSSQTGARQIQRLHITTRCSRAEARVGGPQERGGRKADAGSRCAMPPARRPKPRSTVGWSPRRCRGRCWCTRDSGGSGGRGVGISHRGRSRRGWFLCNTAGAAEPLRCPARM